MSMSKLRLLVHCIAASLLAATGAMAQDYPSKQIHFIVPNAVGGPTDASARILAERLGATFGQGAIVENKPGGLGQIAFDYVARAPADGYTILLSTGSVALQPVVNKNFPYDVAKTLTPAAIFAESPLVFGITSALPVKTLPEFIAYAKANPGKLNYASQGALDTFSNDLFKIITGVDTVTIRYNGNGPAVAAVIANQSHYTFPTPAYVKQQEAEGKMRGLAVTTGKRSDLWPELPPMAEAGVPGYDINVWFVTMVHVDTPRPILEKLHKALMDAANSPEAAPRLRALGTTPTNYTLDQARDILVRDLAMWAKIAKDTGFKPE
jgi:tripartite-type tricarboxylate transporter receptor subunit TctC